MTELDGIIYSGKIKNLKIKYVEFTKMYYERKEVFFFLNNNTDGVKYKVHIIDESNDTSRLIKFKEKISLYYKNKYITKDNFYDLNTSSGILSNKINNDLIYYYIEDKVLYLFFERKYISMRIKIYKVKKEDKELFYFLDFMNNLIFIKKYEVNKLIESYKHLSKEEILLYD